MGDFVGMSKADRIASKRAHIAQQVSDLERNEVAVLRVGGGPDKVTHSTQIGWHRGRLALLDWAANANDSAIAARIAQLEASVTAEELACKYGNMQGFSEAAYETLCSIELLELALGTHPAVAGK